MQKELCILHANCQGDELATVLSASPEFQQKYTLERYTNYTREQLPPHSLSSCSVFLYQHLGEEWGTLASQALLQQLAPSALALCIPNMFFKGYWPFWTGNSPIDFGDSFLNRLIEEGARKDVILRLYLHKDIRKFADPAAILQETLAREREKEQRCFMRTVDFMLERWQAAPAFYTVNHPGKELVLHVANAILAALHCPPVSAECVANSLAPAIFPSYADFELPIHPQVAAFHNLDFGDEQHEYSIYGRKMTFAGYISRYIDCRQNGFEKDFIGYLQLV